MDLDMAIEEVQLYFCLIKEKREYGLDKQAMTDTESKMEVIRKMVKQEDKEGENVEEREKLEELEITFQQMKIDKLFTDNILKDLRKSAWNLKRVKQVSKFLMF